MSHDAHHAEGGAAHGTLRDYTIGFILSVILTAIPFWLVMERPLEAAPTAMLIVAFAVVQIIVHMVYFLHMNARSEGGWTMIALVFTLVVVGIAMAGSMWVMHHLTTNMMPAPHEISTRP